MHSWQLELIQVQAHLSVEGGLIREFIYYGFGEFSKDQKYPQMLFQPMLQIVSTIVHRSRNKENRQWGEN